MANNLPSNQVVMHYGPTYYPPVVRGESLAACRPGAEASTLTTHKPWVTCEKCKQTEKYRYAK